MDTKHRVVQHEVLGVIVDLEDQVGSDSYAVGIAGRALVAQQTNGMHQ